MSTPQPKRKRDRVASLELPPGRIARCLAYVQHGDVLLRLGLCLLAAILMWAVTQAWAPPFAYRTGDIPTRDIVARTSFTQANNQKTKDLRQQKRQQTICIYQHDDQPLKELRSALKEQVFAVLRAESYAGLEEGVWTRFLPEDQDTGPQRQAAFDSFRAALGHDMQLAEFETALESAFKVYDRHGLLEKLGHRSEDGSQMVIRVHPLGRENYQLSVDVEEVRIANTATHLRDRLGVEFAKTGIDAENVDGVVERVLTWIQRTGLPTTLSLNIAATEQALKKAESFAPARDSYSEGTILAAGGKPLSRDEVELLQLEHAELVKAMPASKWMTHSLAYFGMFVAIYVLCGVYALFNDRRLLTDWRRLCTMLGLIVVTVTLCRFCSADLWRAEIIPLMLFGLTVTIAYDRELALLLSACVALVVCFSFAQELAELVILVATVSSAILLLNGIRSRTKLIYVGIGAGLVAFFTSVGVGTLVGQTFGVSGLTTVLGIESSSGVGFSLRLLVGAGWFGFCAILAGLIMTGLLPFIERLFDVQTDISLLELGDAAHPLLQELARRAPGTYNHSINVASLAEVAAEAIGANGLLVRVGAYFHDIGKMLKPNYFVENQQQDLNRHESLVPAMSTLVIVAHVKDGADLARQHRLPQSIVDFIEQHHGTTLVEYFYQQAAKQTEQDPDSPEVDETDFRYPGPKPQTREAGVMMLADAAESASRTLVDPAPARIESLVHEIVMKKLLDGQFEDCGLTLKEINTVEDSLVKSLTAVYHGRVKYPDQQTA